MFSDIYDIDCNVCSCPCMGHKAQAETSCGFSFARFGNHFLLFCDEKGKQLPVRKKTTDDRNIVSHTEKLC